MHDLPRIQGLVRSFQRRPLNLVSLKSDDRKVHFLLTSGLLPGEVAKTMKISVEQVYTHRFRLMRKLNIQSFDPEAPELA